MTFKTNKEVNYNRIVNTNSDYVYFLDYVNNFITVKRFAEYYEFTLEQANNVIDNGKRQHELRVKEIETLNN
jgi:radical SAM superfamily enzyme|tara:strand:- start:45 stop:260 length:216 start_codon:yes stop_codon:yes gene_type:complete